MKDYAIAFARILLGLSALLRGIAETFGIWGGPRMMGTTTNLAATAGVSNDWLFYVVSIGLIILGAALLLGMVTRGAAWTLLALTVWHGIANGRFKAFFVQDNGCELVLLTAALCWLVAAYGPGPFRVEVRQSGKK
ncbi:MAG: hypothetical protein KF830_00895 [Planctomycetes bacterium]|nr:hypothetical protein [Planctomycetota bacterium]